MQRKPLRLPAWETERLYSRRINFLGGPLPIRWHAVRSSSTPTVRHHSSRNGYYVNPGAPLLPKRHLLADPPLGALLVFGRLVRGEYAAALITPAVLLQQRDKPLNEALAASLDGTLEARAGRKDRRKRNSNLALGLPDDALIVLALDNPAGDLLDKRMYR